MSDLLHNDLDLPATVQDRLAKTTSYKYAADSLLKSLKDNREKTYTLALNSDRVRKALQFPTAQRSNRAMTRTAI